MATQTESKPAAGRLERRFADLRAAGRAGFVAFITAGDPDRDTSAALLAGLPAAGVDVIELGMPFTDPMADGPAIQASSQRALAAGASLATTLELVRGFRAGDDATPIVLMGYFNPIMAFGVNRFVDQARDAGVDGLIVVDLPPEEDAELREPAAAAGISVIRLATPTTDADRLPTVLTGASGFVYYVSVAGVTGGKRAAAGAVADAVAAIKAHTDLAVAVGFGITTPDQAGEIARVADAAVVGSAIVSTVKGHLDGAGRPGPELVDNTLDFVRSLADGVRAGRR